MERIFIRPHSLAEALAAMERDGAVALAGGTDLLVAWRELTEEEKPAVIVDLTALDELKQVEHIPGSIRVGALCTYRDLAGNALLPERLPVLAEGAFSVGSPQIRNRGTVGGSLGNASPAADLAPVWILLDAVMEVAGGGKTREIPAGEFLKGYGKNALEPGELITHVRIPLPAEASTWSFVKVGRRNAGAIARLNGACRMVLRDGVIRELRLVIGAATPTPLDMKESAGQLLGRPADPEEFRRVGKEVVDRVKEISGVRASARWKFPAVENIAVRLLMEAAGLGGAENE